ncbi:MAG: protoporphyrinogen oxidase HemJ [Rickettsiales bacterium]
MMDGDLYHWIKALHVIAVISWMAGMLYLPRLFVYHSQVKIGSPESELFKTMERRLLRIIINPAMIVAWGAGTWLIFYTNALDPANGSWMHYKLTFLIIMQIVHAMMARFRRNFANDINTKSTKFYRIFNEVPAILMIGIVIMVIVRPV